MESAEAESGNISSLDGGVAAAAAERRIVATTVRCPLCAGYGGRYQRGRPFRMHLLSPVHQLSDSPVRNARTGVSVARAAHTYALHVLVTRLILVSVQEDAEAVSTAVRLAEAAADAEAAAFIIESRNADAVRGSQAGQTGEDHPDGEGPADVEKANEKGMIAARGGDLETLRSLVDPTGVGGDGGFDPHTATDIHGEWLLQTV